MERKCDKEDKILIQACIKNDRRGQERLYRKYFGKMMSYTMKYAHSRDEGLEIVNLGFLRVFKKVHTFAFNGSFEGWIRKLIFHAIADFYKKQSKQLYFLELAETNNDSHDHTLEKFYAEDLIKLVDYLPAATQNVFRLFALEGYSHKEIGNELGISIGTSKWHVSEARKKLKKLIYQEPELKDYVR